MTISLKADIQTAVEILKAYGAKRVILFGSAARSSPSPHDIDLACEGLPPVRFFEALGKLLCALSVPVDLVDLKEAGRSPSLQQRISREGVLLYEAD
jgi:predicted nucleotidyltransferase